MRQALSFATLLWSFVFSSGCQAGELPLGTIKLPPGFHLAVYAEPSTAPGTAAYPSATGSPWSG
jgi:hypothetical protein